MTWTQTIPPFRALREATGLSQRAVERALGWNTGRLSTIERGLVPNDEERVALLAFLGQRLTTATPREPSLGSPPSDGGSLVADTVHAGTALSGRQPATSH